jgi:hypothetical protein
LQGTIHGKRSVGGIDEVRPSFHDFYQQIHTPRPTVKGTAGCLIVWFKAVLFAQKLYI